MTSLTSRPMAQAASIAALLVICALVYAPGLNGPLILDDFPSISPLFDINSSNWREHLGRLHHPDTPVGRPVSMASFFLNALLHGANTWYWKATNLLIHLVSGILIFLLTGKILRHVYKSSDSHVFWMSIAVTSAWLLHPLHISTTLYTVQRMTQLSALFTVAGMLCYAHGREKQLAGPGGSGHIILAYLLFLPLAILSKENGILLVPMIFLLEICIYRFSGPAPVSRRIKQIMMLSMIIPALLLLTILIIHSDTWMRGYEIRDFTPGERLLTETRVMLLYLRMIALPVQSFMGFFHDDLAVSSSLFEPATTLFSLGFLLLLCITAIALIKRAPVISFGLLLFLTGHLIESTVLPLELMFEHRNYLPLLGIFLAISAVARLLIRQSGLVWIPVMAFLVALPIFTFARASTWSNESSMYSYMYAVHPASRRLTIILANNLVNRGQYENGLKLLGRFDGPGFHLNTLYIRCRMSGKLSGETVRKAGSRLNKTIRNYEISGLIRLTGLRLDNKCDYPAEAGIHLLNSALKRRFFLPDDKYRILLYLAHLQHKHGDTGGAINSLEEAAQIRPGFQVPYILATRWLLKAGQTGKARIMFNRIPASGSRYKNDIKALREHFTHVDQK